MDHVIEPARTVPSFTFTSSAGVPSTSSMPTGSVDDVSNRSHVSRLPLSDSRIEESNGTSVPHTGFGHVIVRHQKNTDGRASRSLRGNKSATSSSARAFTQPAQYTNASASGLPPEASVPKRFGNSSTPFSIRSQRG